MNASKLDQLGDIKSHSHIANSKERLIQYKNHATLAASVAQLNTMKQTGKKLKDDNIKQKMNDLLKDLVAECMIRSMSYYDIGQRRYN